MGNQNIKPEKFTILIQSILGGHAPTTHFSKSDQFKASLGIDPAQPIDDNDTIYSTYSSGLLRPVPTEKFSGTTLNGIPLWIITHPKGYGSGTYDTIYVYDYAGSVYSYALLSSSFTGIGDLNDGGSSHGNGATYNDNYIYFARDTTIARYGPLDGSPAFTDDYWVTTLGKTPLTNPTYPAEFFLTLSYPNHPLHRHSDGKLYIGDVVGNQGAIHYISTSKTTVEGDTDNGSTYNKLSFGYGLWPTAIESYGSNLAIAIYENGIGTSQHPLGKAKMAFWDTTSQNINQITWVEFPDEIITGLKNINGVLYVASGTVQSRGCRITRFVGGYTFEEVLYLEDGESPMTGAMDGDANRLLFGSFCKIPEAGGCVYSLGLQKASLSQGVFSVMNASNSTAAVTTLSLARNQDFGFRTPFIGWSNAGSGGTNNGLDLQGSNYGNATSMWWSGMQRIGRPFKITKIRIPLAQQISANMAVTPTIILDDGTSSKVLTSINNTNYAGKKTIVIRPENLTGDHNFWLELRWHGSTLCTIGLPITIEYELTPDD